jgi:hypothetical protein
VWRDVEIADAGAIGQDHRHRRLQPALPPTRFEEMRDGAGAECVALERVRDGDLELLGAIVVERNSSGLLYLAA